MGLASPATRGIGHTGAATFVQDASRVSGDAAPMDATATTAESDALGVTRTPWNPDPTRGRVSNSAIEAEGLATSGVLARCVADAAAGLDVLAHHRWVECSPMARDCRSIRMPSRNFSNASPAGPACRPSDLTTCATSFSPQALTTR
jgi:hypothetical protein